MVLKILRQVFDVYPLFHLTVFFFEVKNLEINNIVIKAGRNLKTDEDGIKMEPDKFSIPILANIRKHLQNNSKY